MNPTGGLKRSFGITLAITSLLLLLAAAWNAVSLSQAIGHLNTLAKQQARFAGREIRAELATTSFQRPSSAALLEPDSSPDNMVFLRQVALVSGGGAPLWSLPPKPLPDNLSIAPQKEWVGSGRNLWVYTAEVGEGRTLVAIFEAPSIERQRDRFVLLAVLEISGFGALAAFWAILALKLQKAYAGITGSISEAGKLIPTSQPADSVQAVASLFQSTVSELRSRTKELEQLHLIERRRAEDIEDLAAALCSNLDAGYLRFDQDGMLSGVNRAARQILGMIEVPKLGDPAGSLLVGYQSLVEIIGGAARTRQLLTKEEVPGKTGLLLQAAAIPLFNSLNQFKGILLLLRDRTQEYSMGRTLREREALSKLGEVSAGVAHEVRNALGSMVANLKLMGQDHPSLNSDRHFDRLSEEVRGLEKVVQNLLYYARPLPLEKDEIGSEAFFQEVADQLRDSHPEVEFEVSSEIGVFSADREALARALLNLGRNAAEANMSSGSKGRKVRLTLKFLPDGGVEFAVEDAGPGLPEGGGSLFTPFSSQKAGGTGLGLAIARKIAREHGGDLTAHTSGELGGARFVLTIV